MLLTWSTGTEVHDDDQILTTGYSWEKIVEVKEQAVSWLTTDLWTICASWQDNSYMPTQKMRMLKACYVIYQHNHRGNLWKCSIGYIHDIKPNEVKVLAVYQYIIHMHSWYSIAIISSGKYHGGAFNINTTEAMKWREECLSMNNLPEFIGHKNVKFLVYTAHQ